MLPRKDSPPAATPAKQIDDENDEPDDWDKRIIDTGCSEQNEILRFCFVEKKDWRLCKTEMEQFRKCWEEHGNSSRTGSKAAK